MVKRCAPSIHPETMRAVVTTESSHNPFAVGVVGGYLSRQPKTLDEALAVVERLEAESFNYSLGISQVNKYNLKRLGLDVKSAFEPCKNLEGGGKILQECFISAQKKGMSEKEALKAALSCYYSGDHERGIRLGYVDKVYAAANGGVKKEQIKIIRTTAGKKGRRAKLDTSTAIKNNKKDDRAFVF
jgi:type IV secretion system protein VirB1